MILREIIQPIHFLSAILAFLRNEPLFAEYDTSLKLCNGYNTIINNNDTLEKLNSTTVIAEVPGDYKILYFNFEMFF